MSAESAIRARLLDDSTITDLVGSRIWLDNLPQNAVYPALVIEDVTVDVEQHLGGLTGLDRYEIDVTAYGDDDTYNVKPIRDALIASIGDARGTWDSENVRCAVDITATSGKTPRGDASGYRLFVTVSSGVWLLGS